MTIIWLGEVEDLGGNLRRMKVGFNTGEQYVYAHKDRIGLYKKGNTYAGFDNMPAMKNIKSEVPELFAEMI